MAFHAHQAVPLQHAQRLAHRHLADLELARQSGQAQAGIVPLLAAENAGAQLTHIMAHDRPHQLTQLVWLSDVVAGFKRSGHEFPVGRGLLWIR